jgi:hypothetical protein
VQAITLADVEGLLSSFLSPDNATRGMAEAAIVKLEETPDVLAVGLGQVPHRLVHRVAFVGAVVVTSMFPPSSVLWVRD